MDGWTSVVLPDMGCALRLHMAEKTIPLQLTLADVVLDVLSVLNHWNVLLSCLSMLSWWLSHLRSGLKLLLNKWWFQMLSSALIHQLSPSNLRLFGNWRKATLGWRSLGWNKEWDRSMLSTRAMLNGHVLRVLGHRICVSSRALLFTRSLQICLINVWQVIICHKRLGLSSIYLALWHVLVFVAHHCQHALIHVVKAYLRDGSDSCWLLRRGVLCI